MTLRCVRLGGRGWVTGVGVVLLMLVPDAPTSAHQPDEYLGLTHIAIFRDRVQLFVSLTPGAEVVLPVLARMDANSDLELSPAEEREYAETFRTRLALAIDNQRPELRLTDVRFPTIEALRTGQGTIQLNLEAFVSGLSSGRHSLFYANNNSDGLSVYLVAALKPASSDIAIVKQERDWFQRQIIIQYDVAGVGLFSQTRWSRVGLAGATAGLMLAVLALFRRRGGEPRERPGTHTLR